MKKKKIITTLVLSVVLTSILGINFYNKKENNNLVAIYEEEYVQGWAVDNGYIDTETDINESCTRLEAVDILYKARYKSYYEKNNNFDDVDSESVDWANYIGITTGDNRDKI